jgi:uncharacterized protein YxeA
MEETHAAPNRTVIILLGIIVALLIAIVAYFAFANGKTGTASTGNTDTNTNSGTPSTPAATEFDPATATKVPAGETPEQYVIAYFDAVVAGDFQTAYDRLPTDKKAAQDQASFGEQLKGYGVSEYTIDSAVEEGDEAKVTATASMAGGQFQYLWTFVKDGDGWLVKSRTLPGMGQ